MSDIAYLNSEFMKLAEAFVSVEDRGFQFGDGVYEVIRVYQNAPHLLRDGDWESRRDAFTEVVLDTLAEYAPKIRDAIVHRRTLVPPDIETMFGLREGNPHHGDMTLDQFFHMRPVPGFARYQTPIAGLYLCGAGSHPGGGITGIPGRNAAREILKDGT